MSTVVDKFTFNVAPPAKVAAMAQTISDTLTALKPVNVTIQARAKMPTVPASNPPIHSAGFTPTAKDILLADDLRPTTMAETLAHEVWHAYDAQLRSAKYRQACLALLPAGWVWNAPGYSQDGREVIACYSSVLFGVPYPPPFTSFYAYKVPQADIAKLQAVDLADYSASGGTAPSTTPLPAPVDVEALQAEVAQLQAQVTEYYGNWMAADEKAGQLGATVADKNQQIGELEKSNVTLTQDNADYQKAVAAARAALAPLP